MSIKRFAFVIAAVAATTSPSHQVPAQNGRQVVDFSGAHPDGLPEGFVAARTGKGAAAEWKVRDDPAANGGRVLEQTSSDRTDYRFPLAIYQGVSAANAEV